MIDLSFHSPLSLRTLSAEGSSLRPISVKQVLMSREHKANSNESDKVNILMVDDQPSRLLSYESILEGLGQTLITASSGEAGSGTGRPNCSLPFFDIYASSTAQD